MNHFEAIILALDELGGDGTIKEVDDWINTKYPNTLGCTVTGSNISKEPLYSERL